MAYTLMDEDGELGHGPSINGRTQLEKYLATVKLKHPALSMLLVHGATHLTLALAVECKNLAAKCKDAEVKSTLQSLAKDARKAKQCVMMVA